MRIFNNFARLSNLVITATIPLELIKYTRIEMKNLTYWKKMKNKLY